MIGCCDRYLGAEGRDENEQATHKWMMYVRGPRDQPSIQHYVQKVWFFLHPSYRPNDLVQITWVASHFVFSYIFLLCAMSLQGHMVYPHAEPGRCL